MLNTKKGLTLLEIILAAAIMAIGIVPIMRFGPTILQTRSKMTQKTESIFLATRKVEDLRGRIFNNFSQDYNQAGIFPNGTYEYSVTDDLGVDIKAISVSVWHTGHPDKKFILNAKVAQRGLYIPPPVARVANFTQAKSYNDIQSALNEAQTNDEIRMRADTFIEDILVFVGVKLTGGWNEYFDSRDGYTTVNGSMQFIEEGSSEIKYFIIE